VIPAGEERATLFAALTDLIVAAQAFRSREQTAAHQRAIAAFDAMRERLSSEIGEYDGTLSRLSELLTGTANALKGEPDELTMHDWSDLPSVATSLVSALSAEREARAAAVLRYGSHLSTCISIQREGAPCDCGFDCAARASGPEGG
jgi:hypothetical protein